MSLTKSLSEIKNSLPSVKSFSQKMPSVKSFSQKMPSVKSFSQKMPSLPKTVDVKSDNMLVYFYQNIIKNIVIILIFMLIIFFIYVAFQAFNLNFNESSEINEEKTYIFKKNIREGHGKYTPMKRHTGNVNQYCFGTCFAYDYDPSGIRTCKKLKSGDTYFNDVSSACCMDITKKMGIEIDQPLDWKINAKWQKNNSDWFCNCYLGVNTEKGKCCNSWITGTIVKSDHPDSDCLPENKGKSYDGDSGRDHKRAMCDFGCGMAGMCCKSSGVGCKRCGEDTDDESDNETDCRKYADSDKACRENKNFSQNKLHTCDESDGKCKCPWTEKCGYSCDEECESAESCVWPFCPPDKTEDYLIHEVHYPNLNKHLGPNEYSEDKIGVMSHETTPKTVTYYTSGEVNLDPIAAAAAGAAGAAAAAAHSVSSGGNRNEGFKSFSEGYGGIGEENCDVSLNEVVKIKECKDWWRLANNCQSQGEEFCRKMTALGENNCLQYPCCLWETKWNKIVKNPKWTDRVTKIGEFSTTENEKERSILSTNVDVNDHIKWNNDDSENIGRCIKGKASGPHDKDKWMKLISDFNKTKNKKIKDQFDASMNKLNSLLSYNGNDVMDKLTDIGCSDCVTVNAIGTNDISKNKIDEYMIKIFNDSKGQNGVDGYYYSEYKNRPKGGVTDTYFYRKLNNKKKVIAPNSTGFNNNSSGYGDAGAELDTKANRTSVIDGGNNDDEKYYLFKKEIND